MTDRNDAHVDRFFTDELLPLAAQLKRQGVRLLEEAADPAAPSYFQRRRRRAMTKSDFESGGSAVLEAVGADFARLWSAESGARLAPLAKGTAQLARELRSIEEQSAEVSNFVYVMY